MVRPPATCADLEKDGVDHIAPCGPGDDASSAIADATGVTRPVDQM
jgi:hypothetical protein